MGEEGLREIDTRETVKIKVGRGNRKKYQELESYIPKELLSNSPFTFFFTSTYLEFISNTTSTPVYCSVSTGSVC